MTTKNFLVSCIFLLFTSILFGQALNEDLISGKAHSETRIGFNGSFKLGNWSAVYFNHSDLLNAKTFELLAPDGNGRMVKFKGPVLVSEAGQLQGLAKIGRGNGEIRYELLDVDNNVLVSGTIGLGSANARPLAATVPLVLTIEPANLVAKSIEAIQSQLFDVPPEFVAINDSSQLPLSWLAYEGVQVIYLTTSSSDLIHSISAGQLAALENWVLNGGKLIFCAGGNGAEVFSKPNGLARFLPGKFDSSYELSSRQIELIERYSSSSKPLLGRDDPPLIGVRIKELEGIGEPKGLRDPIVIRKPMGFGHVVFSAVEFDTAPFSQWSGQKNYLLKATVKDLNLNRKASSDTVGRGVVRVGYRDLIGQLMLPLEKFSRVGFVNFTIVALLIGLFIVCVGPGDFFLLRKFFKRMEWTWLTFSLLTLAFCGLAMAIAYATKPSQMQINQLEIVDIDAQTNAVRGSIWTNLYSPDNSLVSVSSSGVNTLGFETDLSSICWLGIPGKGLGSMQSQTTVGSFENAYLCELDQLDSEIKGFRSKLSDLPIQVSSTKTLFTRYWSKSKSDIRSRLRLNKSSNRLNGFISNPLDVELRDCRLLFENWVYILRRPIQPGESVDIYSESKERTANFYFTRREENGSDKEGGLPWNPQDDNLARIAEMLMFYESAQGRQYTSMTHSYQGFVDLSEQASVKRAILFGRAGDICTKLDIDSGSGEAAYDQSNTFVRIVLPVD